MKRHRLFAALLCLSSVTAQAPALLELTSAEPRVLVYAKQLLGSATTPPAEQGTRKLTVDNNAQIVVRAASPLPEGQVVSLVLRPAAWLAQDRPAVEQMVRSWKARMSALAPLVGLPSSMGAQLVDDVEAVIQATAEVRISIEEPGQGLDVGLTIEPTQNTGLARWTSLLSSGPARTPLPSDPDAALRLQISLASNRVERVLEPFLDTYNSLRTNPEDLIEARTDLAQMVACFDGTFELVADNQGIRMALGLADAAAHQQLMTSEAVMRRAQERLTSQRIEVEYAPAPFRHRTVEPLRTVLLPDQPLATLTNAAGEVVSYTATIHDAWLSIVGNSDGEETMIQAIDGILDGKLFRPRGSPETPSHFLQVQLGLGQLTNYLGSAADLLTVGDFARLQITAAQSGSELQIQIQLR